MSDGVSIDQSILDRFFAKIDGDSSIPPEVRARLRGLVEPDRLAEPREVLAAICGGEVIDGKPADTH